VEIPPPERFSDPFPPNREIPPREIHRASPNPSPQLPSPVGPLPGITPRSSTTESPKRWGLIVTVPAGKVTPPKTQINEHPDPPGDLPGENRAVCPVDRREKGPSPVSFTGDPDHSSTSGVSRPTGTPQANPGGIRAHRAAGMASGKPWIDTQAIR